MSETTTTVPAGAITVADLPRKPRKPRGQIDGPQAKALRALRESGTGASACIAPGVTGNSFRLLDRKARKGISPFAPAGSFTVSAFPAGEKANRAGEMVSAFDVYVTYVGEPMSEGEAVMYGEAEQPADDEMGDGYDEYDESDEAAEIHGPVYL